MKTVIAIVAGCMAVLKGADEVKGWFPETFGKITAYLNMPADNGWVHRVVFALLIAAIYGFFKIIRRYVSYVSKKIAYQDAIAVVTGFRASRLARRNPGQHVAASLHSLASGAYFLLGFYLFESIMLPPESDPVANAIWKLFQLFTIVVSASCVLLAVSRLRALRLPAARLRMKSERRLRKHLEKLGIQEVDPNDPAGGIAARVAALDSGLPLAGLHKLYGRRGPRGRLRNWFKRLGAQISGAV